jgi:uncharacterized membrane protein
MTKFKTAFVILAVVWAFMVPAVAFAATRPDSAVDTAIAFVVYGIGRLICHQRPERSFHLVGAQLPVCARCTGIYAGAALMAIVGWCRSRVPARRPTIFGHTPWTARRVLLVAVAPMAATLCYEWTTGQTPGPWTRALSGAPLGIAVAWIVCVIAPQEGLQARPQPRIGK